MNPEQMAKRIVNDPAMKVYLRLLLADIIRSHKTGNGDLEVRASMIFWKAASLIVPGLNEEIEEVDAV